MNRSAHRFPFLRAVDDPGHIQNVKNPKYVELLITTKLEGIDVVPQAVYFLSFAAIGVPLCINTMLTRPLPEPATSVLLLVLGLISYHVPVTFPSNVQFHPGFPLLMGAHYCHGCGAANLVIMPSTLLHVFTRNHGLFNCFFNVGQFALCICAAETVGFHLGWEPGAPATATDLLPISLMMLTFDLLNVLFVSVSRSIENKEPWKKCFTKLLYTDRKAVLPQRTFLTVVSMLLSSHMGDIAFVIVFIGVISLRFQNAFQRELLEKTEEAETDLLTGVYNIRYLQKWLNTKCKAATGAEGVCSFIFADVDGLKTINDEYGHEIGNKLLIHVARLLLANVRSKDRVVRYGGDEFVIAFPGIGLPQSTAAAMRILQASDSAPFSVNGAEVDFGISIGVASWPEHGETVFDVIRIADRAMYVAKRSGGNRVQSAADL